MSSTAKRRNEIGVTKKKKGLKPLKPKLTFSAISMEVEQAIPQFLDTTLEVDPVETLENIYVRELFEFLRNPEFDYHDAKILAKLPLNDIATLLSVAISEKAVDLLLSKIENVDDLKNLLTSDKLNVNSKIKIIEWFISHKKMDTSMKHFAINFADSQDMISLLSQYASSFLILELLQTQNYTNLISITKKNQNLIQILTNFSEKTALKPFLSMIKEDSLKFFELMSLLDLNKMDFSLLKKLRESLTNLDVRRLGQSDWYMSASVSIDFLNVFIFPKYVEAVKSAKILEDLVDLATVKDSFPSYKQEEEFFKKVRSLMSTQSGLSKLLTDPNAFERAEALKNLRNTEVQLKSDLSDAQTEIEQLNRKVEISKDALSNFEQQIIDLKLEIQKAGNIDARDTIVNEYRKLLPSFDQLISKYSIDAMNVFAKVGVQVIGVKGNQMNWDSDTCETLTGNEISTGKVMKEGIILNLNEQRIVLRRVLLGTI